MRFEHAQKRFIHCLWICRWVLVWFQTSFVCETLIDKIWLKSLLINASICTLFVEITKIIDVHKWKFFSTCFRIVNTWIMSINFCFFSIACRCRHCNTETCNVSICHMCSRLCEKDSSSNESFFDQSFICKTGSRLRTAGAGCGRRELAPAAQPAQPSQPQSQLGGTRKRLSIVSSQKIN